jgi:hypothetical protein
MSSRPLTSKEFELYLENADLFMAIWEKAGGVKMPESLKQLMKNPEFASYALTAPKASRRTEEGLKVFSKFSTVDAVFYELVKVKESPRATAIITNSFIEMMVIELVRKECKQGTRICKDSQFTHSIRTLILFEKGLIPEAIFKRLEWLRKLRNDAAHTFPFDNPTSQIDAYRTLDADCANCPPDFYEICVSILRDFWNLYPTYFLEQICKPMAEMMKWIAEVKNKPRVTNSEALRKLIRERLDSNEAKFMADGET